MILTGADLVSASWLGVLPYLPGDAVKIALAVLTMQLDKRAEGLRWSEAVGERPRRPAGYSCPKGFPLGGKLSPKATDEGRADRADAYGRAASPPHPALRGRLPPSGRQSNKANKISAALLVRAGWRYNTCI